MISETKWHSFESLNKRSIIAINILNNYKSMLTDFISDYNPHIIYNHNDTSDHINFRIIESSRIFYYNDYRYDFINFLNYINSTCGEVRNIVFEPSEYNNSATYMIRTDLSGLDNLSNIKFRNVSFTVYY